MRQTLALVGVVITLLGALMAFSQVPLLVSPPPCGSLNCPPSTAHTSFFVVQNNYTVTVHDTTKLYVSPQDQTICFKPVLISVDPSVTVTVRPDRVQE